MQLSQKQKKFSRSLCAYSKSSFNFKQTQLIAIFSDGIISELKNFFWIVFCIFLIWNQFWTFSKKGDPRSSCIFESFTIFINACQDNSGWKSLYEWYAQSYHSLLTHWLPMTSIVCLKEATFCNIFRCNYLRNDQPFLNFLFFFCIF